jgi:hypothetical protein
MGPYRQLPEQPARPERRTFPGCTQRLGSARFEIAFSWLFWSTRFVVTRDDSWAQEEILGVVVRRQRLGRKPEVKNLGWDWEELAIYPADAALRQGLFDEERVVLCEWDEQGGTKDREGAHLLHFIRAEIARLHA